MQIKEVVTGAKIRSIELLRSTPLRVCMYVYVLRVCFVPQRHLAIAPHLLLLSLSGKRGSG
jgi:hypothetical protein